MPPQPAPPNAASDFNHLQLALQQAQHAAALGRHVYQLINHQMPQKGTRTALSEAEKTSRTIVHKAVTVRTDTGSQRLRLTVQP